MKIELVQKGDPRLKKICDEITNFEKKEFYQNLINQIKEVSVKLYAFAAAAPQFGINKRFILMISAVEKKVNNLKELEEFKDNYETTPYFNPKIIKMEGLQFFYEACMSTGNVIGKVPRPYRIEIEYQDIDGNKHHKLVEDFEAIVFCHEIDHLDGIEFTDKAIDLIYDAELEQRIEIRKNNPRKIISKDLGFEQCLRQYYIDIAKNLSIEEKEKLRKIIEDKSCTNCCNMSCKVNTHIYGLDACVAWNNEELIGKTKILKKEN